MAKNWHIVEIEFDVCIGFVAVFIINNVLYLVEGFQTEIVQ